MGGATAWVTSGAAALTGRAGGPPLVAPAAVVDRMQALGAGLGVDTLGLATERSRFVGLHRQSPVSAGGQARLLRAADGWVAVSLARPEDRASVPAWVDVDVDVDVGADVGAGAGAPEHLWSTVAAAVAAAPVGSLVAQGVLLGMPVAAVGERTVPAAPVTVASLGAAARPLRGEPLVVDLSSLWAGPLCGRLLAQHGCRVVKVESAHRPDGARFGNRRFFRALNGAKEQRVVDLRTTDGVGELRALLADADVVIEGSRPRALHQLGCAAEAFGPDGPAVWVSITGHGRTGDGALRVGFGDDAAAGGGLVAWDQHGPCFVADAVADPLTGVAAAAAAVAALAAARTGAGERVVVDAALAGVAAWVAGSARTARWEPAPPGICR